MVVDSTCLAIMFSLHIKYCNLLVNHIITGIHKRFQCSQVHPALRFLMKLFTKLFFFINYCEKLKVPLKPCLNNCNIKTTFERRHNEHEN